MSDFIESIINAGWVSWFIFLFIVIGILWLFAGGGDYEYVGLNPLKIGVDSTKYIDNRTFNAIERSNYHSEKITGFDATPNIPSTITNELTPNQVCNIVEPLDPICTLIDKPRKVTNCSKGERICREVLEEIYNKPFPCVRPKFLKNPETNRNLELDCYNEELKIALEYSGIQHYKWPNFTGHSKEAFIKQARRDKYKIDTCDKNGVYLITVPYNVSHKDIPEYIKYYLPENYVQRINNFETRNPTACDSFDFEDN